MPCYNRSDSIQYACVVRIALLFKSAIYMLPPDSIQNGNLDAFKVCLKLFIKKKKGLFKAIYKFYTCAVVRYGVDVVYIF